MIVYFISMGGKYNFENETLMDISEYDKNVDIHEMIHKVLSTKTTYGQLIELLNRIYKFDDSKKWLFDILIDKRKIKYYYNLFLIMLQI